MHSKFPRRTLKEFQRGMGPHLHNNDTGMDDDI